jgi:dTDP-4-amino-4,6-dideoxygalactose transaminase
MYRGLSSAHSENLPVATAVAQQVLCLPIYPDLDMTMVQEITCFISTQSMYLQSK